MFIDSHLAHLQNHTYHHTTLALQKSQISNAAWILDKKTKYAIDYPNKVDKFA